MNICAAFTISMLAFGIFGCASPSTRNANKNVDVVRLYIKASGQILEDGWFIPLASLAEHFERYKIHNIFGLNITLLEGAKEEDAYRVIRIAQNAGFSYFELSILNRPERKNEPNK